MAMTIQARRLKKHLREMGIRDQWGSVPRVRTERTYVGRDVRGRKLYEYGFAWAIVLNQDITPEQIEELKERLDGYLKYERLDVLTWIWH